MATNLRTLRRLIGDTTGDVLVVAATSDAASTSSFSDTARLAARENRAASIVHRLLYFSAMSDTANEGHEAAVTDFDGTAKTLTFTPALPSSAAVTGDEAELWSVAERIGSIGALHRLINYAIAQVADLAGPEAFATAQTFNARTGTLVIPDEWAEFGGAYWTDASGYQRKVPSRFLRVSPAQRTVELWGNPAGRANRRSVQLFGYPRQTALVAETDTTDVDPEWIVESVAGSITLAGAWKAGDAGASSERRANFWAARAQLYRRNVTSARRGLGIALP